MLKAILAFCLLIPSLRSQPVGFDFDPAKSQIHWSLSGNVHTTHGTFQLSQGHLEYDSSTGAITGELVVDASSGESGNHTRDNRMNKEVLESDKFKQFKFLPHHFNGSFHPVGSSSVRVSGEFFIHGSSHELTIPMEVVVAGRAVSVTGKFSIPYVDWGMEDPSNFLFKVDKAVEVEVLLAGVMVS